MARRETKISKLVHDDPVAARSAILDAVRRADGFQRRAAELLDVHWSTLRRWVAELGLADDVKRVNDQAKREGRLDPRGRPRKAAST